MLHFNEDIYNNIMKELFLKDIINLKTSSKIFKDIDEKKYILNKFNYNYDEFIHIYLDCFHYNSIMYHLLEMNKDTLYYIIKKNIFIEYPILVDYLDMLYNMFNFSRSFEAKILYIYYIQFIKIVIKFVIHNKSLFCLLFAEYKHENKKTKYIFNYIDITNRYNKLYMLYNIINYSKILYKKIEKMF